MCRNTIEMIIEWTKRLRIVQAVLIALELLLLS